MIKPLVDSFHFFSNFSKKIQQIKYSSLVLLSFFVVNIFCLLSYILTPFAGDIRVFFSSAFLADQMGNFPHSIDASWEIKPWGNRMIAYLLYKVGIVFFDFNDKISFEIGIKAIFSIVIITSIIGLLYSLNKHMGKQSLQLISIGFLLFFSLFSVSYHCALQAEYFSIVITLISLALLFTESRTANLLSGVLVGLLLVIKGITGIFALQFFLIAFMIKGNFTKRMMISLGGLFVGTIISLVSFVAFPNALLDLYYATAFQSSLESFSILTRLLHTIFYLHEAFTHIPILLPGLYVGAVIIPFIIWKREWKELSLYILLWVTAFIPVIIQGKYFSYHYLSFVIPAIFSIIMLLHNFKSYSDVLGKFGKLSIGWVLFLPVLMTTLALCSIWLSSELIPASASLIVITFSLIFLGVTAMYRKKSRVQVFYVVLLSVTAIWMVFNSFMGYHYVTYSKESTQFIQTNMQLRDELNLNSDGVILYLDDGIAPYFFESRSFCRYYYLLPLQRANFNPKLSETSLYSDTLMDILSYDGRIIILQPSWFCLGSQDNRIAEKIKSEYIVISDQPMENYRSYVILMRKDLL